ncbi:MAG: hypothetical protein JSW55_08635 [Chloroflexota bacterium]|nr:MAG: hypothetical protein JSW55_08635 [Chloroflexota bacterium]
MFGVPRNRVQGGAYPSSGIYYDKLPPNGQEKAAAYQALAKRSNEPNPSVAVRSSALDEDGSAASFAGQFESYLNSRRGWHARGKRASSAANTTVPRRIKGPGIGAARPKPGTRDGLAR